MKPKKQRKAKRDDEDEDQDDKVIEVDEDSGRPAEVADMEAEEETGTPTNPTDAVAINKTKPQQNEPIHTPNTTAFLKELSLNPDIDINKLSKKFNIQLIKAMGIVNYFVMLYVATEHQENFPKFLLKQYNVGLEGDDELTEEEIKDLRPAVEKYGKVYIDIEDKKKEPIERLIREAIPNSSSSAKMSDNNYREQYQGTPQTQTQQPQQMQFPQQQQSPIGATLTTEAALLQYIMSNANIPDPMIFKFMGLFELQRNLIQQNPMELLKLLQLNMAPQKAQEIFNLYMSAGPSYVVGWGQQQNPYLQNQMQMPMPMQGQQGNSLANLNPMQLQQMMQNPNPMAMMQFAKSMGNGGGMGMGGDSLSNMFLLMWMSDWMESKQDKRNDRQFSNVMTTSVMKKLEGGDNPMGAGGFNPMLMQSHAVEVKTGPDGQPYYRYEPIGVAKQDSEARMYQNMLNTFVEFAKMSKNNESSPGGSGMMDKIWTWAMTKAERFSDPMEMVKMFKEIGGALGSKSMSDQQFQILVEAGLIKKKEEREDKKEQREWERERLESDKGDKMTEKYFEMISKGLENLAPTVEAILRNRQGLQQQQPPQVIRQQGQPPGHIHYNQPVPDSPPARQISQAEYNAIRQQQIQQAEYEHQQSLAEHQQQQQQPQQPIDIDKIDFYNTPPEQLDAIAIDADNKLALLEKLKNKALMEKSRRSIIQGRINERQQYMNQPQQEEEPLLQSPEELEAAFDAEVNDVDPLQTPFRRGIDRNINFNSPIMTSSGEDTEEPQPEPVKTPQQTPEPMQVDEIAEEDSTAQVGESQTMTKQDSGDDSQA